MGIHIVCFLPGQFKEAHVRVYLEPRIAREIMQIERIEEPGKGKITICLDDGRFFTVYRKEVRQMDLESGAELTDAQLQEIYEEILIPRARKRAMHLLEQMDHTECKLREKLRQSSYPEEVVEDAIAYVKKFRYVDDLRYACNYVRYRSQSKSRRQLLMELYQKGVSREDAQKALSEEYGEEDESDKILRWMQKKHYDVHTADVKEKQKMYQFLLRKGFHSEDILRALS